MSALTRLLRNPFGPYPEDLLLSTQCKSSLDISLLQMQCGSSPVGLDDTEFVARAPQSRNPVKFYGIIDIDCLEWLSPEGQKYLQKELRRRHRNTYHDNRAPKLRNLQGLKIKIWVECIKNMSALFLTAIDYETSLIISSKSRRYTVISLDPETHERSRNFLTRYRLWATVEQLIQDDPERTPIEGRTIDWLVDQYLRRIRVNSVGRFPRHVPRAEVIGIFAAHADWILAQHLATKAKTAQKLNVKEWISFCADAATARHKASQHSDSRGWGLPKGGTPNENIFDLSRFGVLSGNDSWEERLKNASKRTPKKKDLSHTPRRAIPPPQQPTEYVYDSDFSEASSSSYSDSTDDDLVVGLPLRTHKHYLQSPVIHPGQHTWRCQSCSYVIDLLNLTDDNTKALSPTDCQRLREKMWQSFRDRYVEAAFFMMIKDHLTVHDNSQLASGDIDHQVKVEAADVEIINHERQRLA